MSELITLTCPTCSGKLQVYPNTTSLACQHCGNEYLVRHEAGTTLLESFARCPRCNRNDKAEKVSAILESQTRIVSAVTKREKYYTDGYGHLHSHTYSDPSTHTETSSLAKKLSPPQKPYRTLSPRPVRKTPHLGVFRVMLYTAFGLLGIGILMLLSLPTLDSLILMPVG
jgi:predicted RNA-binding Zn-ribbon protein involved in translation (DUF1610 family)